jgi:pimeloyl-ACP methyl ester carboxylesterase
LFQEIHLPTASGLYYCESNNKNNSLPPVVLIHGAGSNHLCWPAQLRRLAGYRVLALDLPGHGRSNGVALQSVSAYAEQVVHFMETVEVYQAIVVGHSLGGAVALEMACHFSERVAAVGLIASGAYFGSCSDLADSFSNPLTIQDGIFMLQQRMFSAKTSQQLIQQVMSQYPSVRPGVIAGDWKAASTFDLRESISRINLPAWIAAGSEDRLIPLAYTRFLAAHMPQARLQVIPDAGHMVILEQPEVLSTGLSVFLAEIQANKEGIPWNIQTSISSEHHLRE